MSAVSEALAWGFGVGGPLVAHRPAGSDPPRWATGPAPLPRPHTIDNVCAGKAAKRPRTTLACAACYGDPALIALSRHKDV